MNILPPNSSPTSVFTALPSPTVIIFNDAANFGPRPDGRVFSTDGQTKLFSWKIGNSTTTPLNIFWYGKPSASEEAFDISVAKTIARAQFGNSSPGNEIVNLSSSNATLNLTGSALTSGNWYNKDMVIKIDWKTKNGEIGFSQSGVFTVSNGTGLDEPLFEKEATNNDQDRRGGEAVTSTSILPQPTNGPSNGNGNGIGGGSSGDSSRATGGGLSTGAKAGIAVACSIVGIALIGGLVWFLLRRRRRRHFDQGYNAAGQTTNSFIATKEVQASVAESPIVSPFSDHGNRARSGSTNAMVPLQPTAAGTTAAARAATHDDETERPDTAGSGNNMSRNIAHLVEEGMTEADILRLEEEERHLDAEIERAARRNT
ncbi:hypothetical protein TrVFT333_005370 [Trichoderma virens FT-333]|nr:hypothetical protein TrVFT333_005370 [Trichoderma virens FT-333]